MGSKNTRPKLVSTFLDGDKKQWKIFHAKRTDHRRLFTHKGEFAWGRTFFDTRRIYVDSSGTDDETFEITVHELGHVVVKDLGLDDMIEEAFIERFCNELADKLCQLKA